MSAYIIVFFGGALGAALRYSIILFVPSGAVLWIVNGLGSLCMGLLQGYFSNKKSGNWQLFFTTGLLGAFTTFSAFSADWLQLLNNSFLSGLFYALTMTIFSIALAYFGFVLMRKGCAK